MIFLILFLSLPLTFCRAKAPTLFSGVHFIKTALTSSPTALIDKTSCLCTIILKTVHLPNKNKYAIFIIGL